MPAQIILGERFVKAVNDAQTASTVESLGKTFADMAGREVTAARDRQATRFDWEVVRWLRCAGPQAISPSSGTASEKVDTPSTPGRKNVHTRLANANACCAARFCISSRALAGGLSHVGPLRRYHLPIWVQHKIASETMLTSATELRKSASVRFARVK